MIYGIGTDMVSISRLQKALDRWGDRFAERILGPDEMVRFKDRRQRVPLRGLRYLATRYAAKEAFSKAVGLGMRGPMTWLSVQFLNARSGKPEPFCRKAMKGYMEEHGLKAQVSMTDESDFAMAFVVIEKVDQPSRTQHDDNVNDR